MNHYSHIPFLPVALINPIRTRSDAVISMKELRIYFRTSDYLHGCVPLIRAVGHRYNLLSMVLHSCAEIPTRWCENVE